MDHHDPPGPGHGGDHGVIIQGQKGTQIHHLAGYALLRQLFSRLEAGAHHAGIGNQGDIRPLPGQGRSADLHHIVRLIGDFALHRVGPFVLQEDHRVVVPDRRLQQALAVRRGVGRDHLQTGHVVEPRLQGLAVLRRLAAARADGHPDDQRHVHLAAEHIAHFCRHIHDLVHGQGDPVAEHDLHHRPKPGSRRAHAHAGEGGLGDGGVDHPVKAEFLGQSQGNAEGVALDAVVTAHDDHPAVPGHLLEEGLVQGLPHCFNAHTSFPPVT